MRLWIPSSIKNLSMYWHRFASCTNTVQMHGGSLILLCWHHEICPVSMYVIISIRSWCGSWHWYFNPRFPQYLFPAIIHVSKWGLMVIDLLWFQNVSKKNRQLYQDGPFTSWFPLFAVAYIIIGYLYMRKRICFSICFWNSKHLVVANISYNTIQSKLFSLTPDR